MRLIQTCLTIFSMRSHTGRLLVSATLNTEDEQVLEKLKKELNLPASEVITMCLRSKLTQLESLQVFRGGTSK